MTYHSVATGVFTTLGPMSVIATLTLAFRSSLHLSPKLHHVLPHSSRAYGFSHLPPLPHPHQRLSAEPEPPASSPPPSQPIPHPRPQATARRPRFTSGCGPPSPCCPFHCSAPRHTTQRRRATTPPMQNAARLVTLTVCLTIPPFASQGQPVSVMEKTQATPVS
ncbi:hypothetical protein AX14_004776 [Amanita brunnescens Koide BX004]|nr:hypothetical protein AX14_004776 [Amanita brunnescens Koide BX004]